LASPDAAKAFRAVCASVESGNRAVTFLANVLHPVPPADERQLSRLIADLDSNRFATRQRASQELAKSSDSAQPILERALQSSLSPEVSQRLRQVLATLDQAPERLRSLRAIEILEHIATPEARRVLQTLSQGQAHAQLTEEARGSLARLGK
jgi:hypothetical protein